jgi:alpha-glucosidase (family GH31 glycosyl hydrolase)
MLTVSSFICVILDVNRFGSSFLVAPIIANCTVVSSCLWREVYLPTLPAGEAWIHFFTNVTFESGQVHNVSGPIDHFPLFKRERVRGQAL